MIKISGFRPGQNVLILGAGPIGCALTLLLRAKGAGKIVVSEVATSRAAQARDFGADVVVNPTLSSARAQTAGLDTVDQRVDPVLEAVHATLGSGAHISYDACGLQSTLDTAIECTKRGGIIANVAIHDVALQINLNELVMGEKRVLGGIGYTPEDFREALEVLSTIGDEAAKLITSVVPLSDAVQGGFQELIRNSADHVKLLIEVCSEN
jgi:(R,R)-butanediol dehydrogenase/meso-butanediol dehydrogenase/diacetyl reductase